MKLRLGQLPQKFPIVHYVLPVRPYVKRMTRKFTEEKLVIASHNAGKLREIAALLAPYDVEVVSAGALGLDEPEETGATFAENAALKARASSQSSGLPALADDSGLCADALDGQPGIHSARWAETGKGRDFRHAMETLEKALGDSANRAAHFTSTLALAWPDGHIEYFDGRIDGTLVWPPRGENGFGYDPVFRPDGYDITFGEMAPAAKNAITHRAVAFEKLVAACFQGRGRGE